jgi:protoporphyrinogen oxidase
MGSAWRLHELGYKSWTLVEGTDDTGGLAKSVVDPNGFTWDHGVHVLFSHFAYFDSMMDMVLKKDQWYGHQRKSPAWMRGRFVGYPVQNNIWQLPDDDLMECLEGLTQVAADNAAGKVSKPKNFQEWIEAGFGKGVAKHFMEPYNFKVWAHQPHEMNTQWVGERVATIDLNRILQNLVYKREDVSWGPNNMFRYPKHGSGHIWDEMWKKLPQDHLFKGKWVNKVQLEEKLLTFEDGTTLPFDSLVSTMPVDKFMALTEVPKLQTWAADPKRWLHQTVHLVGVGMEGQVPSHLNDTHWVYFPEEEFVFYRLTILSNFSPYMVAKPGQQYSIVVEISESAQRPVKVKGLVERVIQDLIKSKFVNKDAKFATKWHERFEYGYPVPYVDRDLHMHEADDALRPYGVWSRGRFGSWKYEVANQDHSFMLGRQAVDNIISGSFETTFRTPDVVNAALHQWPDDVVRPPSRESPPYTAPFR